MYLACKPDVTCQVKEIAEAYGISRDHVAKIVHKLGRLGYLRNTKGRGGGAVLNKAPGDILLGDFLREVEPHTEFVECMKLLNNKCAIAHPCRLKMALSAALSGFFDNLNSLTFADLTHNKNELLAVFDDKNDKA